MPFPYTRTGTAFSYGRAVPSSVCLPYQVDTYPWVDYFPNADLTGWETFYDDPSLDGVSLNLNLGGYYNSWIGSGLPNDPGGVYTNLIFNPYAVGTYQVDGGYYYYDSYALETAVDLWRGSGAYLLTNPTVISRYTAIGGSADGSTNPLPGHHVYPGVSSYSCSFNAAFIQAKNYGQPVICELWYSLNPNRTTPLIGYNNYSFFGDWGNSALPGVDITTPGGYVKKYQGGILKVNADMNNLTDSDFIAGVSFVGDNTSGVMKIIINGIVIQTLSTSKPVTNAFFYGDTIFEGTLSQIGTAKSNVTFLELDVTFSDSTTAFVYTDSYYLPDTDGLIDTYQCKYAWIVDSYTGGNLDSPIYWSPGMFYTLPNTVLPCAPSGTIPNYIPPAPTV